MKKVIIHLAICHTVIMDEEKGVYNSSSPDELALVNAAKSFGLEFVKRNEVNEIEVLDHSTGDILKYEFLNVLEFSSKRKRMSVIVRDQDGKV